MTRRGLLSGSAALAGVDRRSERSVLATIFVMLVVVSAVFAAAPRLLERAEVDSLERALTDTASVNRRLAVRAIENFGPGTDDDPLDLQRSVVERAADVVPEEVRSVFGPGRLVIDSNRFLVVADDGTPPASPTTVTFRVQPDLDDHAELVDGRRAGPTVERVDDRPVVEVEISTDTADVMGYAVGDLLDLAADTSDAVTRQYDGGLPDAAAARIVGILRLDDRSDPYWFGDNRLHRPIVVDTGVGATFRFTAAVPAGVLPVRPFLVDGRSPFTVEQRRDLLDGAITVDSLDAVLDGLDRLEATSSATAAPGRPGLAVSLRRVLDDERAQQRAARSALALGGVGVLGVALVALAQVLQVGFSRRRAWLDVARIRGASPTQIVMTTAGELAGVAAGAILLGHVAVRLALGGSTSALEVTLLVALFLGSVAAALLLAIADGARHAGGATRARRVAEILVVVLAAAGLLTFRRRGLGGTDIDLLALLVPVLVPLAVVVVVRRLVPLALSTVARFGLRLGPGRLVGVRRAIDDPGAGAGLVTVLVLAGTVATLGLGVDDSLRVGITDASWREVGAPYRIDSRDPAVVSAVAELPGLDVAEVGDNQFRLARGDDTFNVRLVTVETARLDGLVAGTAADLDLPDALDAGPDDGRVPVVAATRIGGAAVRVGDEFSGAGSTSDVTFVVVQTRSAAFDRDRDWVVADRDVYESTSGQVSPSSSLRFDATPAGRAAVLDLAAEQGLDVEDRAVREDGRRDDPLVRAVQRGYLLAGLVASSLALAGVVGLAVVTARQRRRQLALLGLLGAGRREVARAIRWELLVAVGTGVVTGALVGWFVTASFDGRFDLSAFAGGSPVSIRPDPTAVGAAAATMAVVAVAIVAVVTVRIERGGTDDVLRMEGAG